MKLLSTFFFLFLSLASSVFAGDISLSWSGFKAWNSKHNAIPNPVAAQIEQNYRVENGVASLASHPGNADEYYSIRFPLKSGSNQELRIERPDGNGWVVAIYNTATGNVISTVYNHDPGNSLFKTQKSDKDYSKMIIGKWQGTRHLVEYRSDGSYILDDTDIRDPYHWRVEGDRLVEDRDQYQIVKLTENDLVIKDAKTGQVYQSTRSR